MDTVSIVLHNKRAFAVWIMFFRISFNSIFSGLQDTSLVVRLMKICTPVCKQMRHFHAITMEIETNTLKQTVSMNILTNNFIQAIVPLIHFLHIVYFQKRIRYHISFQSQIVQQLHYRNTLCHLMNYSVYCYSFMP